MLAPSAPIVPLVLCLLAAGCSSMAAPELAEEAHNPCRMQGSASTRPPLLGLAIERAEARGDYRVVTVGNGLRLVVHRGSLRACEAKRLETLEEQYGTGKLNISLPTLGGKQLWADEFLGLGWRVQRNVLTDHFRLLDPDDIRRAWGSYEACRVVLEEYRLKEDLRPRSDHLVLLVHGLGRSKDSFAKMAAALEKADFEPVSVNYPSTRRSVREHSEQLRTILSRLEDIRTVSFVTHSLGGIVVRDLLSLDGDWKERVRVNRLVMLAPPNQGSIVASALEDWFIYRAGLGPAGQELTPEKVERIPRPTCPFGVIAGGTGTDKGHSRLIPGDDDGVVAVENTKLDGQSDFLRVESIHTFIMDKEDTIEATLRFLVSGRFGA